MLFSRTREQMFRDEDSPFELRVRDLEIHRYLKRPMKWTLSRIDNALRPTMEPIHLARRLYGRSMLHPDALLELYRCARKTGGAIVEIGSYMGGGTIMMAAGRARAGINAPQIAIDVGGTNDNPHIPTDDIIRDLRNNLSEFGYTDRVSIIEGWSKHVVDQVEEKLAGQKIGLLVVDADGEVRRDFDLYRKFLAPYATIVIDDYIVAEPNIKAEVCYAQVNNLVDTALIAKTRIVLWGTWFGTYIGD